MTQPTPPPEDFPTGAVSLVVYEVALAAMVISLYEVWLAAVTLAVLAPFVLFGLPPDPNGVWAATQTWQRQLDRMMGALIKIAESGWEDARNQLGVPMPFDPGDPILISTLQETRNLMVRTQDEVYRRIIEVLGESDGLSVSEKAARVRNILSITGTENWPARAKTVAVTEVHRAWNMGSYAAAQRVDITDPAVLTKKWNTNLDGKERDTHRRANNQERVLSEPFDVGGFPLLFPGDPTGPPQEVINCRCKPTYGRRR